MIRITTNLSSTIAKEVQRAVLKEPITIVPSQKRLFENAKMKTQR